MAAVIAWIATALATLFVGAGMYGAIVAAYISTALYIGLAVGFFLLIPKRPGDLTNPIDGRATTVREPVTSRKLIYGEIKVSGPLVLVESTNNNKRWHLVIAIAGHEVQKMGTVYFNDNPIFVDHIDVDGFVTQGIYSGKARIRKNLGSDTQVADPVLVSAITKWTNQHRGQGVAYLYIQIDYDRDTYPNGLPNIAVIAQGRKVFDPRISGTFYNPNTALCVRDFLTDKKYGVGAEDSEIDVTFFNSDANTSDEDVPAPIHLHKTESVDIVNDEFTLNGSSLKFFVENKVRLEATGYLSLPGEAGDNASTLDSVALSIISDIDLFAQVLLDNWKPILTTEPSIISKWNVAGSLSYILDVFVDGVLRFIWSTTGSDALAVSSTISVNFVN